MMTGPDGLKEDSGGDDLKLRRIEETAKFYGSFRYGLLYY